MFSLWFELQNMETQRGSIILTTDEQHLKNIAFLNLVSYCLYMCEQLSQDLPASSGDFLQSAFQGWKLIFD